MDTGTGNFVRNGLRLSLLIGLVAATFVACGGEETATMTVTTTVAATGSEGTETPTEQQQAGTRCTAELGDPLPDITSSASCLDENGNLVLVAPVGEWARGPDLAARVVGLQEAPAKAPPPQGSYVVVEFELENLTTDPTLPGVRDSFYLETATGVRYAQARDALTSLGDGVAYLELNPGQKAMASAIFDVPTSEADVLEGSGAGLRVSGGLWSLYLRL